MKLHAVLAVRDEAPYLARFFDFLLEEGIAITVIDNDSSGATFEILSNYLQKGVQVHHLPFRDTFDLREQLEFKNQIIDQLDADWIIHIAPDEIICSDTPGESLREAIGRVSDAGYDVINCHEFVFIPENEEISYAFQDYLSLMRSYYYFAPIPFRLMRIFRKDKFNISLYWAGHRIDCAPEQIYDGFELRHYICLSYEAICRKYGERRFKEENLASGWHKNRLNLTLESLKFPPSDLMSRRTEDERLTREKKYLKHYWQW